MSSELIIRNKIVEIARTLVGIKWVHQGRTVYGMDCGGIIAYTVKKAKISDFDVVAYGRRPRKEEFAEIFETGGAIRIDPSQMKHGDIVIMKVSTFPGHCGIMASSHPNGFGRQTFIHAYAPYKKVIESPYDDFWKSQTWGAYVLPNVLIDEAV